MLHSGCARLQPQQRGTRAPFSVRPCQHVLFVNLLMTATPTHG